MGAVEHEQNGVTAPRLAAATLPVHLIVVAELALDFLRWEVFLSKAYEEGGPDEQRDENNGEVEEIVQESKSASTRPGESILGVLLDSL